MDGLQIELYKSLKTEAASYHDKLQSLWLQKLTLSGAVAGFFLAKPNVLSDSSVTTAVMVSVILITLLAVVMDLKVVEYGAHVRVISDFIKNNFPEEPTVGKWEKALWGCDEQSKVLVLLRSALTVLSAGLPTIALIAITSKLLNTSGAIREALIIGLCAAVIYLGAICIFCYAVFKKPTG